jgi:hypothetical protein
MTSRPIVEEQYKMGNDVINYVLYKSTTGDGNDEVLQHKINGTTESAHITLHPDGSVNFRETRTRFYLETAVRNNLAGYKPEPSLNVIRFLLKVQKKI